MLPRTSAAGGTLATLVGPNGAVTPEIRTIKGIEYAVFPVPTAGGDWTATYDVPDTTAPTLTGSSPAEGATDVEVPDTITATFSEPVAGVSGTTFTVSLGATPVAGNVTYDGGTRTVTFTPLAGLTAATTYSVALMAGITDSAATPNALAPTSWTFTTAAALPAPAAATSAAPVDGGGAVAPSTLLSESFTGGPGLPDTLESSLDVDGSTSVADGWLSVDRASVTTSSEALDAGRAIEVVATLQDEPGQDLGFSSGAAAVTDSWAFFGTGPTPGTLYARTSTGSGPPTEVPLAGDWLGSAHRYRIEWTSDAVVFSIDGAVVHTATVHPRTPHEAVPTGHLHRDRSRQGRLDGRDWPSDLDCTAGRMAADLSRGRSRPGVGPAPPSSEPWHRPRTSPWPSPLGVEPSGKTTVRSRTAGMTRACGSASRRYSSPSAPPKVPGGRS